MRLITQKKIIFFRERRYKISLQALLLSRFGDAWYIINSRRDFKLHRATQVADEKENGFIKLTMDNYENGHSLIIYNLPRESTQGSQKIPLTNLLFDIAEQRRHLNNQDHSTVNFLGPFFLSMCNVGMCPSLSTFLLFLIMTYDETTF